jgi:hypothetical protein
MSFCDGKTDFDTKRRAKDALSSLRKRKAAVGERVEANLLAVYRCKLCGKWHVGKRVKKKKNSVDNGEQRG